MSAPESCDMFVALPSVTVNNAMILGKNSDRPASEVQEVIYQPAADHAPGEKVNCTYISIDQASHTHAVILSKPAWMWGAEMGANEHGVAIGNEAVWTTEGGEHDLEEKLLGMDFVRLGLERASTAAEAVDVIGGLLIEHGQGGPCYEEPEKQKITYHNAFMIADATDVYVMDTAGKHWAAEKIEGSTRNISNFLSVGDNIAKSSDGDADAHFTDKYKAPPGVVPSPGTENPENRYKCGKEMLESLAAGGKFSATNMMEILRNEEGGICRVGKQGAATTGSMVSVIYPASSNRPSCHWFTATPNPKCSFFKPFVFTPNVVMAKQTKSPEFEDDPVKIKPRFQKQVDRRHSLYKAHSEMIKPLPGDDANAGLVNTLKELELGCLEDLEEFMESFDPDRMDELNELFKDVVESEVKFYQPKTKRGARK